MACQAGALKGTAVWVLLLWLSIGALAAESVPFSDQDSRLAHTVRLNARFLPLDVALSQLAEQTGVPLKAEGVAADLRLTSYVSDLPLRLLLERVATLFHLSWRRAGDGSGSEYTLFQSPADRDAVRAAQAADWQEFGANIRRIILAAGSPTSLGDDPRDRAARAVVSFAAGRATALFLASLPDPLLSEALQGQTVRLPFSAMSPSEQGATRRLQSTLFGERKALHGQEGAKVVERDGRHLIVAPPTEPQPLEKGGVELRVVRRVGDGQRAQLSVGIWHPRENEGGLLIGIDPQRSLSIDDRLGIRRHFDSRHCARVPSTPFRLPRSGLLWDDALTEFAREMHLNVVSDSYDRNLDTETIWPPGPGAAFEEVLDRLCVPYDYTWNASEPLLLFRARDWSLERDRQIPERMARRWRRMARERGAYPLSELAFMANLNEPQRLKLWKYAGERASVTVQQHRDLLLLFGTLRPEQQMLAHADGLGVDRLDVAQQKLLSPLLAQVRPGTLDLPRSLVRMEAAEPDSDAVARITFVFRDGERRSLRLECRAAPVPDPLATVNLPVGATR